jgi:hypothetical protein
LRHYRQRRAAEAVALQLLALNALLKEKLG